MMHVVTTDRAISLGYGGKRYSLDAMLGLLRGAGFRCLDWYAPECELFVDGRPGLHWEACARWAHGARERAERLGMRFVQMHSLDQDYGLGGESIQAVERMTDNALGVAAILGVRSVAIHPIIPRPDQRDFETCIRQNAARLRAKAELAAPLGLRLAVENMLEKRSFDGARAWRFATNWHEHRALVEEVGLDNVGYCFDTGHAHYMATDPYQAITQMGKRLFAVHVHDNDTFSDQHLTPYQGTVDFQAFTRALARSGYEGDMTMEVISAANNMPPDMAGLTLRAVYRAARHLVDQVEQQKREDIHNGVHNQ